jgi:predicted nucleotidyltransferase
MLTRYADRGIIIGGVAVSLLGAPRFTADVDAVILLTLDDLPELLDIARQEGLLPRMEQVEAFARRSRVVLLQHQETGVPVDISLGLLAFEVEAVERSKLVDAGELQLRLPTPEDLIILKAVAHRPKDMVDIKTIIEHHSNLDWDRIQFWVEQFAEVLEMPELWQDVVNLRPEEKRKK